MVYLFQEILEHPMNTDFSRKIELQVAVYLCFPFIDYQISAWFETQLTDQHVKKETIFQQK